MGIKSRIARARQYHKLKASLRKETKKWNQFELKYSSSLLKDEKTSLSWLMIKTHIIEKGITMPERRMGFGYDRIRPLIRKCKQVIKLYSNRPQEVQATINVLEEYLSLHQQAQFALPDDIENGIKDLLEYKLVDTAKCFWSDRESFFGKVENFPEFAHQRHSVRWYSDKPVDKQLLVKAIELAQTAPSACNRQSTKVYVVENEEKKQQVLSLQNGNRGFGHKADKILLLTSDMRYWAAKERTSGFLDVGIFTMNLLYALHYYKICACTLNAHLSYEQREALKITVGYSDAEIPVVFILIGNAPDKFMIAGSQRLDVESVYHFV